MSAIAHRPPSRFVAFLLRHRAAMRLAAFVVRHRAAWPAVGIVIAATAAYWFTLSSLADFLRLDTPLAYLLMLPFFSLLLAMVTVVRYEGRPAPRILLLDLVIGSALLLVALLAVTLLPAAWSTYYWVERPDVISLVLFVSGALIICYGTTWFWRLRSSIAFLVLMWPALYLHLMAGPMQSLTDATNSAVGAVASRLPLGVVSSAGNVLTVHTDAGSAISVVLSTACSGANGLLGIALIGSAMALMFDGRRFNKLLWVLTGLLLVFALNIARIVSLLTLARWGHPGFALGGYHAVIGLVLFVLTIGVMRLLAPLFRLRWGLSVAPAPRRQAPAPASAPVRRAGRVAIVTGLAMTAALALFAEAGMGDYASFVDGTGGPTVAAFSLDNPLPNGWGAGYVATYAWAQQYFGANSQFDRYVLQYGYNRREEAWMDVVRTDDQGSLDAYNLQSCFLFHNYRLGEVRRVDLGGGVTGLLINYADPASSARWASVSWALPILYKGSTAYERITLTSNVGQSGGSVAPDPTPTSGVQGMVLSLLNSIGGQAGSDPAYRTSDHSLQAVASSIAGSMTRRAAV